MNGRQVPNVASTPAENLENMDLGNGWTVASRITRKKRSTGGHFSIGYKVVGAQGKEAFMKALDFSAASQSQDPIRELQKLTEAYNYERDLLTKCKNRRLNRVMVPIIDGTIHVPGYGIYSPVSYLIFELAKGDIRDVLSDFSKFDLVWCLKSLHNVAVGLHQLHSSGIAHQDLKPSNVLFTNTNESKLADLGRATAQDHPSPIHHYQVPGDLGYAPIDLSYTPTTVDGFEKRFLADLYLMGSLFFFHFTGVAAVHALRMKIQGVPLSNTSFLADLPYLQHAYEETLVDLRRELSH